MQFFIHFTCFFIRLLHAFSLLQCFNFYFGVDIAFISLGNPINGHRKFGYGSFVKQLASHQTERGGHKKREEETKLNNTRAYRLGTCISLVILAVWHYGAIQYHTNEHFSLAVIPLKMYVLCVYVYWMASFFAPSTIAWMTQVIEKVLGRSINQSLVSKRTIIYLLFKLDVHKVDLYYIHIKPKLISKTVQNNKHMYILYKDGAQRFSLAKMDTTMWNIICHNNSDYF